MRDGSTLRVLVLEKMTHVNMSLAGIICPRMNSGNPNASGSRKDEKDGGDSSKPPEPFAMQARHFTELRLMNREVDIVMQALDRKGNILGTVLHPKGNIAVELTRAGLAKVADQSSSVVSRSVVLVTFFR